MARQQKEKLAAVTTGLADNRPSLRDGFNGVLRALPGNRAFLLPSSARSSSRQLDTSVRVSGPHDFAVRFGVVRPHEQSCASPTRPSHPRLACRDDRAHALLRRSGMAGDNHVFLKNGSKIFLVPGLDNRISVELPREFRFFAHAFLHLQEGVRKAAFMKMCLMGESG